MEVLAADVSAVDITPSTTQVRTGDVVRFRATVKDRSGKEISGLEPTWLFSPGRSAEDRLAGDAWLREPEDAHDHDHGHTHHDSDIRSYSVVRDEPIAWAGFAAWLEMIRGMRGADLLRVKGIVNVADHPRGPVVIHGVQHVFHPPKFLEQWPEGAKRAEREDQDL